MNKLDKLRKVQFLTSDIFSLLTKIRLIEEAQEEVEYNFRDTVDKDVMDPRQFIKFKDHKLFVPASWILEKLEAQHDDYTRLLDVKNDELDELIEFK